MKLTTAQILDLYLDENGGEIGSDEGMIEDALDAECVDDDVEIGYEEPEPDVGIMGGHYVESGGGELRLEWYDDTWPELQERNSYPRSKSIITRVYTDYRHDESVEEGEDIPFTVNVHLEEAHIEQVRVKVIRDGRHHIAFAWRVTARYAWEAVDV